jgi:hypothetical protein
MSDGWVTVPRRLSNDLVADIKVEDWEMAFVVAQKINFSSDMCLSEAW